MRETSLSPMVAIAAVGHLAFLALLLSLPFGANSKGVPPPVQIELVEAKKPLEHQAISDAKKLDVSRILLHNPNPIEPPSEPKEARYLADKAHRATRETRMEGGFSLPGAASKPGLKSTGRARRPRAIQPSQTQVPLRQKNDLLASIPKLSSLGKAYNGQGRQASLPHAGSLLPSLEDLTKANGTPAASLDEAIQKGQLINLNTKEFKYTSYFLGIKSAVEADMSYPEDMALQGISGGGLVAFAVERDGTVSEARIVRSSGHPSFDHEIVRAIRMASPLNPIPKRLEKDRLFLIWPFEFIIDRFFS